MAHWKPIPGETPIDDISGLKIKIVRTRVALHNAEAESIRRAVIKYIAAAPSRRTAPFNLKWAKRLHKEMFGHVWRWAGVCRTRDLNLGVAPHMVETQLQCLFDDLAHWERESAIPLVEQAAMLHHRAVSIHPFLNGNGRWARLLANIWLKLHHHPTTNWPEETVGTESAIRQEYLAAIRKADQGDYLPLFELHRRFTP